MQTIGFSLTEAHDTTQYYYVNPPLEYNLCIRRVRCPVIASLTQKYHIMVYNIILILEDQRKDQSSSQNRLRIF
jgi:hypothetical protein